MNMYICVIPVLLLVLWLQELNYIQETSYNNRLSQVRSLVFHLTHMKSNTLHMISFIWNKTKQTNKKKTLLFLFPLFIIFYFSCIPPRLPSTLFKYVGIYLYLYFVLMHYFVIVTLYSVLFFLCLISRKRREILILGPNI